MSAGTNGLIAQGRGQADPLGPGYPGGICDTLSPIRCGRPFAVPGKGGGAAGGGSRAGAGARCPLRRRRNPSSAPEGGLEALGDEQRAIFALLCPRAWCPTRSWAAPRFPPGG